MRKLENWEKIKWQYVKNKFTPRIKMDLLVLGFDSFDKKVLNSSKQSLFIYGPVKTGKTILAAQLLMNELQHIYLNGIEQVHNTTLFVSFPEMLQELKESYGKGEVNSNEILQKYANAHYLVIDDFLTARPTDWVLEILYYIINHRYEYMLKTVITCNFSLPELEALLQEQRITSRIDRSYLIVEKKPYKE